MKLIHLLHDGMTGQVLYNGDTSAAFGIVHEVKIGLCVSPVLFNLFFTCMLLHAVHDVKEGVYVRYQLDSSLFFPA